MKRLAIITAAVLVVTACRARDEAATDTATTPMMTPAPADTGMMKHDTGMMRDTARRDTTRKTP